MNEKAGGDLRSQSQMDSFRQIVNLCIMALIIHGLTEFCFA